MTTVTYDFVPQPKQALALQTHVDELFYGGAAGGGKDLHLDTPVLTTRGWSTQGELQIGDEVFDQDGNPTFVTAVHPVEHNPCFELQLSTGERIIAGEGHLWNVANEHERNQWARADPEWQARRRASRPSRAKAVSQKPWVSEFAGSVNSRRADEARASRPPAYVWDYTTTLKTREIADTTGLRKRYSIPVPAALKTTGSWQSAVPPWVMGMWLGDGTTKGGSITHGTDDAPELIELMAANGYPNVRLYGDHLYYFERADGRKLVTDLRDDFGPSGHRTKFIPEWVFNAPYDDRLGVVQGLLDADGHAAEDGGVMLSLTHERLLHDAARLIATLGIRVHMRKPRPASYRKADGTRVVTGTVWSVAFTTDVPVFAYRRKVERLNTGKVARRSSIYILNIQEVPSVPTRCITVANPRGLYLAGHTLIPTHNSRWGRAEVVRMALMVPGSRSAIFRRTHPQLRKDVVPKLRAEMPQGVATFNKTDSEWTFTNGSVIELGHMANEDDYFNYQSAEYQLLVFEEVTQFLPDQYRYLLSRLRASGPVKERLTELGWRPRMIATGNPGGIGHNWVKQRWVDAGIRNKPWRPEPTDEDPKPGIRCFIPARLEDNPHIDSDYADKLDALDPVLARALKEGDWDILKGVRFSQWRQRLHVLPVNFFDFPIIDYPRCVAVDWGVSDPFCALWMSLLPDGHVYVYRELYARDLTPKQQAQLILDSEEEGERIPTRPIPVVCDPAMWARSPHMPPASQDPRKDWAPAGSIARSYQEAFGRGSVLKANNARVTGWALLDELMVPDKLGLPRLLVSEVCTNLIRTLPSLPRAKVNPEDVDTHAEDHAADALRYGAMYLAGGGIRRVQDWTPRRSVAPATAKLRTASF